MSRASFRLAQMLAFVGITVLGFGQAPAAQEMQDNPALDAVRSPVNLAPGKNHGAVVIAIVDDGVRISHQELAGFIWQNPREIPANHIDDDGNGYVDDVHGWDVSDNDDTLIAPDDRIEQYSHGTHLAGLVARIARRAYGNAAVDAIRIMPVKAISDEADTLYLKQGFQGIRYAIDAGADIILCAWGVNHISPDEERILEEAEEKGILIVASAGNFSQELEQYPAAHRSALAVAALDDSGRKAEESAYGQFVDIAAPGVQIRSASGISDSSYQSLDGSSMAAAITAGGAALVSSEHPDYSTAEISACLVSSADPFERLPLELSGKLGAGQLNIGAAIECALLQDQATTNHVLTATKGYLRLRSTRKKHSSWSIAAPGSFNGIRFRPMPHAGATDKQILKLYSDRSSQTPISEFQLSALPESFFTAASSAYLTLESRSRRKSPDQLVQYEFETIDFSKLHCSGTQKVTTAGLIEDGSGDSAYSPAVDCKWLITAPEGQQVNIRFVEFDTEGHTDFIYFFNGAATNEDIMARFSGPDIPPELTTWSNQVLVWFVTDGEIQGKGWKAEVRFVTPTIEPE